MPLQGKAKKVMKSMKATYGDDAEQVFYATANKQGRVPETWAKKAEAVIQQFMTKQAEPDRPRSNGPTEPPAAPGWPKQNAVRRVTGTGGNPAKASNAWLLYNTGGAPDRYSSGKRVHVKVSANEPETSDHPSAPKDQLRPRAEVIVVGPDGVWGIDKRDYILMPGGGIDDGERPQEALVREVFEELGRTIKNIEAGPVVEVIWPAGHQPDSPFKGERTHFFLAVDGQDNGSTHADREQFVRMGFDDARKRLLALAGDVDQEWAKANNEARLDLVERGALLVEHKRLKPLKLASVVQEVAGIPEPRPQQFVEQLAQKGPQTGKPQTQPAALPAQVFNPTAADAAPKTAAEVLLQAQAALFEKMGQTLDTDVFDDALEDPKSRLKKLRSESTPSADGQVETDVEAPDAENSAMTGEELTKSADAATLLPRKQYLLFTPEGKVVARRLGNRRLTFPEAGSGRAAPYEQPIRLIPQTGIPDQGYHGYEVGLHVGDADNTPDGYEALPAQDVLNDLYASMGLSTNKPYLQLDRARARAILREMKKRKPQPAATAPAVSQPSVSF